MNWADHDAKIYIIYVFLGCPQFKNEIIISSKSVLFVYCTKDLMLDKHLSKKIHMTFITKSFPIRIFK